MIAQRALAQRLAARPVQRLATKKASNAHAPVQRAVTTTGDVANFAEIVTNFFAFAEEQGGEAQAMLEWFRSDANSTLELHSTAVLSGAFGYTDCRIGRKEAHTLTDDEWAALGADATVVVKLSIRNSAGAVTRNDAKQYYTILHELLVHAHPFYVKMLAVRAGNGAKTRVAAGYGDGPDAMGARAEHQALLNKTNRPFYDLYDHIVGKLVGYLMAELPAHLAGLSASVFMDEHASDIAVQYTEEANAKSAAINREIALVAVRLTQLEQLPIVRRIAELRRLIVHLGQMDRFLNDAQRIYQQAYAVHTLDYRPPDYQEPEIPAEGRDGVSAEVLSQLPYFNPDAWNEPELTRMREMIGKVGDARAWINAHVVKIQGVLAQLEAPRPMDGSASSSDAKPPPAK